MKVITSKIFKGKKMFLIDDENYQDGGVIEDTSVDESKEFLKNWYLNRKEIPEFKDISENFLKQLPLVKNIEYKGYEPYSKKGNVYMLPSTNKFVKNHEYTHAIHFRASGYNYGKNIINSVTNKSDKYLSDPTEVYARLNVLRQSLNLDPLKKYNLEETKEILNNANKIGQKSSQGVLNSLENGDYSNTPSNNGNEEQIFELLKVIDNKPENLQKLLNEIALNNQKTDNFKNLAKYGKVIEDNQGQWKYPGQITKINSNNITMKGVPYPVYGVSDIGDKKLMLPNRNYKFKGNSVTEYPILAQAGYNVPIQGINSSDNVRTKLTPKQELSSQQKIQLKQSPTAIKNIKAKEAQEKAERILKSQKAYEKRINTGIQSSQELADETGAIGDKISLQNLPYVGKYIPNILDVTGALGSMASGLGRIPLNVEKGDYGQAALSIATPLTVGALAGIGTQNTGQFVNNIVNPLAGTGDLAKGIYNKGITALERNSIRKSIVPELKQVSKTNGISNQLPTPPQEIYFDINTQIPNREVINLNRNRISDLPPAPFVTSDIMPEPINDLLQATRLSDLEYTRLQNLVRNNSNYLQENNIYASDQALNHFMHSNNPNDYINNFLNLSNNTRISDLTDYNIWNNKLNKIDLAKYSNLSYGELVKKNPTLAEKLKKQLTAFKFKSKKFLTELDTHAGKIIKPKQSVNREVLEKDINSLLKKGLGIKKTDIPIQIKTEGSQIKVFLDSEKNGNFIESGYISIPEEGLNQKKLTETLMTLFKKENKGVQKTMDFPTNDIRESNRFPSNINTKGVGGELGEAIKQSLKLQNKNWNLLSSQSHTNEGAARYLTEFLNGRKTPIDISANPEWLKEAEKIKKLYPKGIKKEEVIELMKKNPDLRPTNIKFKYPYGGTIKVLNTKIENGKKYFLINE
jgi:hypothetical protein